MEKIELDLSKVVSRIADISAQEKNEKSLINNHTAKEKELSELIERITSAYHQDWEKKKLEFAQDFLARTWAGMPLPVLSICGKGTQEIRYSKYLSYFLDGSKPHGIGARYLNELLYWITKEKIDTYAGDVQTEKWIGRIQEKDVSVDCYCDIVICCKNHVILIEQKINSGESPSTRSRLTQLARYDKAIEDNTEFAGKKLIRIFLTPTGKQSNHTEGWNAVSYHDLVRVGLHLITKGGLSGAARENLKRFLLDVLLGPFDKTENEIQELVHLAKICVLKPSFQERLNFDRLVNRNELLIKIIMEG